MAVEFVVVGACVQRPGGYSETGGLAKEDLPLDCGHPQVKQVILVGQGPSRPVGDGLGGFDELHARKPPH